MISAARAMTPDQVDLLVFYRSAGFSLKGGAPAAKGTSGKTSVKILDAVARNAEVTIPELASRIGVSARSIERNLRKLQEQGRLRRVGPAKGGHWEVVE